MTRCQLRIPLFAFGLLALAAWGLPGCGESRSSVESDREQNRGGKKSVDPAIVAAPVSPPASKQSPSQKPSSKEIVRAKATDQFPGEPLAMLAGRDAVNVAAPKANVLNPQILGRNKVPIAPRKPQILIKDRKFVSEKPGEGLRVLYEDLDLLRVINMDPVTEDCEKFMPSWLKDLSGKKVRIRGYMAAGFLESGITNFVMARDTQACCFGPNTKIYHLIEIGMKQGLTAEYLPMRPLEVEGTFRIEAGALDGTMFHLYFIDNAEIVSKK